MTIRPQTITPLSSAEGVEDRALLAAFVADGDERAFAELAQRHAGLVYHAALRRTGETSLSEEVAQNTFALMARKSAALVDHPFLAGWLHRTATWLAGDAAAREDAHRRRMKRFAETAALEAAGDDPLESALPSLDQALDSLRESDRRLIWMRFHEGQSFQTISDRLGQPQEAARKATQRAVGRLGQALRRAGLTLSTVALTSALSGILTSPAPAMLVRELPAAALAAAGPLGRKTLLLHTLNTMTAAKQIAAAAVLVASCVVPVLALQEVVTRRNPAGWLGSWKASVNGTGKVEKVSGKRADASSPVNPATVADVLTLLRGVPSARDPFRAAALAAEALGTAPPELIAACMEAVKSMKPSLLTACLNLALFQRWTEVDPVAAMREARQSPDGDFAVAVDVVCRTWMRRDPEAMRAWLVSTSPKEQRRVFRDALKTVSSMDSETLTEIIRGWSPEEQRLWANAGLSDALKTLEIARHLSDKQTRETLMGSAAASAGANPVPVLDWCLTHFEGVERSQILSQVVFAWSLHDGKAARDWYLRQQPGTVDVMALANAEALRDDIRYADFCQGLSAADQAELDVRRVGMMKGRQAAERISGLPPGTERTQLYGNIARRWADKEPEEASSWVDSLPAGPERDDAVEALARIIQREDGPSALIWAESIGDEKLRHQTLPEIWKSWRVRDGVAATRWLRGTEISADSRAVIEAAETAAAQRGQ